MTAVERYMRNRDVSLPSVGSQNRQMERMEQAVANRVGLAGRQVDGSAWYTERAMQRLVEIDHTRRQLAGDDEFLNQAMGELEIGFIRQAVTLQANMFSQF